uniref:Uncharacterized protein n=1 Tax=Bacteroides fragilis TaxID=817 RepID=Q8RM60_BACFG|nr:unknown [Bacteroides fragilis]
MRPYQNQSSGNRYTFFFHQNSSPQNNRFPTKNREYPYPIQCYARHGIFVGWLQYFQSHGKFLVANNPLAGLASNIHVLKIVHLL